MPVRLLTLGGLRAFKEDAELGALPSQRLRSALLVYIAIERRCSREQVAALFWPESDTENARHALRQTLLNLRRGLGGNWLESSSLEVRATSHLSCDALEFQAAVARQDFEAASALYEGPFLNAVHLLNNKAWENWVDVQRAALARSFRRSCREWVNVRFSAGDLDSAVYAARLWVARDPFDDEAQHRLIEVLAAAGETGEALRQFELYANLLTPDGLEPLDSTKQLVESLSGSARLAALQPLAESGSAVPEPNPPKVIDHAISQSPDPRPLAPATQEPVGAADDGGSLGQSRHRRRMMVGSAILAFSAVIAAAISLSSGRALNPSSSEHEIYALEELATLGRYVIFPFLNDEAVTPSVSETDLLLDAMRHWQGIDVVSASHAPIDAASGALGRLGVRRAAGFAQKLGGDRFVMGEVSMIGDSVRASATVFDARSAAHLRSSAVRIGLAMQDAGDRLVQLTEGLLFSDTQIGWEAVPTGTRSVPARQAFARGMDAIQRWNLARADSQMAMAARIDPRFAQSLLWLALVRWWQVPDAPPRWAGDAVRAYARRQDLGPTDRRRTDALAAHANGDVSSACNVWRDLAAANASDFVAWYSKGMCLRSDDAVIADHGSQTGWSFRSSQHEAVQALRHAFNLHPPMHAALSADSYDALRALLYTATVRLRTGKAVAPDTGSFLAYPTRPRDTLEFIPFRAHEIMVSPAWLHSAHVDRAVEHQRALFNEIATSWASALPRSARALEAVAVSRELLGDPTALDTLERARRLAAGSSERLTIAISGIWMRVKFATPEDTAGLRAARALADTILREHSPENPGEARLFASIATLTGRAHLSAAFNQRAGPAYGIAAALTVSAPALASFAALGGPRDSLNNIGSRVEAGLRNLAPGPLSASARSAWLLRPATLAFPDHGMNAITAISPAENPLQIAEAAWLRGDHPLVRTLLDSLTLLRRAYPAEVMIDAVYPEAWLLAQVGDTAHAIARLDGVLQSLAGTAPFLFADVIRAGALVRAMTLRAELAAATGDDVAAVLWANAVLTLWAGADTFLQPTLERLSRIAKPL